MNHEQEFHLADGRRVLLVALAMRHTYHSALEGSEEGLSELYRDGGLESWVTRIGSFSAGPCSAEVFDPGTPALPSVLCVAHFKMFGQGQADGVFYSELLVGWFAESFFPSKESIATVLLPVHWDERAKIVRVDDL